MFTRTHLTTYFRREFSRIRYVILPMETNFHAIKMLFIITVDVAALQNAADVLLPFVV